MIALVVAVALAVWWTGRGRFMRLDDHPAPAPPHEIAVADHIWTIGELIEAATGPEMPEPEGERVGRFRVINGGLMTEDRIEPLGQWARMAFSGRRLLEVWGLIAILALFVWIAVREGWATISIAAAIAAWIVYALHHSFTALLHEMHAVLGELKELNVESNALIRIEAQLDELTSLSTDVSNLSADVSEIEARSR